MPDKRIVVHEDGPTPGGWVNSQGDRRGAAGFKNGKNNRKYIPGLRVGSLTVVDRDGGTDKHPKYRVRCDCGKEYTLSGSSLSVVRGCKKCNPGGQKRKYGNRLILEVPLYRSWVSMRRRCNPNTKDPRNKNWAGKGVRVCDEWQDFSKFEEWSLANGYREGLSLDRIDSDGNYEPSNCEWVTRSVNSKRCRAQYRFEKITTWDHIPLEAMWGAP